MAWETAILVAHGHEPEYVGSAPSVTSRARLREIDLHFDDLRHEAGSRCLTEEPPIENRPLGSAKHEESERERLH
jgi:hypothetical protein